MLYLAPLQGFTDVFYRIAFVQTMGGIDKFFTSFFEVGSNEIIKTPNRWEISPSLNSGQLLVPQTVAKDAKELILAAEYFMAFGFKEMNLNLGCPFPMLVKRKRGCGALPYPTETAAMLEGFFDRGLPIELSIKTRLGHNTETELPELLKLINHLPIKELITHFRLGVDQYKGEVRWNQMDALQQATDFKIVGNGDIRTPQELAILQNRFPTIADWMIGRGMLINPLLALEIKGETFNDRERAIRYNALHKALIDIMLEEEVDQNRYLNSVKAFWHFHSQMYENGRKINKEISKTTNIAKYNSVANEIWNSILKTSME